MSDSIDDVAVEGNAVEQQEHAEADHDDGQSSQSGDEDAHIMLCQGQHYRCGCRERGADAGCQLYLLGDERSLLPLVRGNQNERIDENSPQIDSTVAANPRSAIRPRRPRTRHQPATCPAGRYTMVWANNPRGGVPDYGRARYAEPS